MVGIDKREEVRSERSLAEKRGISKRLHQDSISCMSISSLLEICPLLHCLDQNSYPAGIGEGRHSRDTSSMSDSTSMSYVNESGPTPFPLLVFFMLLLLGDWSFWEVLG